MLYFLVHGNGSVLVVDYRCAKNNNEDPRMPQPSLYHSSHSTSMCFQLCFFPPFLAMANSPPLDYHDPKTKIKKGGQYTYFYVKSEMELKLFWIFLFYDGLFFISTSLHPILLITFQNHVVFLVDNGGMVQTITRFKEWVLFNIIFKRSTCFFLPWLLAWTNFKRGHVQWIATSLFIHLSWWLICAKSHGLMSCVW